MYDVKESLDKLEVAKAVAQKSLQELNGLEINRDQLVINLLIIEQLITDVYERGGLN